MLYSMKVHPPLWRAGLRQNFRIFQNEDIKSILGTMLQENGGDRMESAVQRAASFP